MAKLTKEQKKADHDAMCEVMKKKGYNPNEKIFSATKANILGTLMPLPIVIAAAAIGFILFFLFNGNKYEHEINPLIFLIITIVLIIFHELTHGAVAAMFCAGKWDSISFGFIWEGLNPYCSCNEPLRVWQYRLVIIMPMFVEGLLVVLIAAITGWIDLLFSGILMTWSAGGDLLVLYNLRHEERESLVIDHPYLIGCTVFRKIPQ